MKIIASGRRKLSWILLSLAHKFPDQQTELNELEAYGNPQVYGIIVIWTVRTSHF